ncbi:MAG: hypothetical protein ACTSWY_11760 [Promethearchaeota archaeon]
MSEKLIQSLKEYPANLEQFFVNFVEKLSTKLLLADGDVNKFIETGPRQKLTTTYSLSPSTITFEINFEKNKDETTLQINWNPLFKGTKLLGIHSYNKNDLKNRIKPYILNCIEGAIESMEGD